MEINLKGQVMISFVFRLWLLEKISFLSFFTIICNIMYFLLQIVILDEAHNIEDSARSAASWQVTQDEVQAAMQVTCINFHGYNESRHIGSPVSLL